MQVKILSEAFYDESLFGLGLSKGVTSGLDYEWDFDPQYVAWNREEIDRGVCQERHDRMSGVAEKLAPLNNGHNKCLYQMMLCLDITAPRYWWPEMDQYKVATVTQSESTMHTIHKKEFTVDDFQFDFKGHDYDAQRHLLMVVIDELNILRDKYNDTKDKKYWRKIIQLLPQSYLQRRILTCNYATLRNIIEQRTGHRLSEWAIFIDSIRKQCAHPELLP